MNRISTLVWMLVIVVASFLLYQVKYDVQSLHSQIAETTRQLEVERESLNVVAAEWAYLNRPERLQQLAAKYLSTSGVKAEQVAEVEAISFPKHLEASVTTEDGIRPVSARMSAPEGAE